MKLLLDEHYRPSIAVQLRARKHDVQAVAERADLRTLVDPILFERAQAEHRALCTENVGDFLALDAQFRAAGRQHYGLILTNNRTFPRSLPRTPGNIVRALDILLDQNPTDEPPTSFVIWLQRPH